MSLLCAPGSLGSCGHASKCSGTSASPSAPRMASSRRSLAMCLPVLAAIAAAVVLVRAGVACGFCWISIPRAMALRGGLRATMWSSSSSSIPRAASSPAWNKKEESAWLAAGGDPKIVKGLADSELPEAVPNLKNWVWARGLIRHFEAINLWTIDMGAADFAEVADNADELAKFLGDELSAEERERLLRGVVKPGMQFNG
eukprot:CAMPEP_0177166616 /NCGR_PEP_ID=MMETSP0367-20130122/8123_1 /TAXON_ID=447022 ORGANISM="Scrippsiella hangoei-like, Strain SHHI-4" /NCGR_SAMPLE_ID=MMETSP0367 /ASSEMBLY_ACC=CAM_ASM_000362 /LENGTH=199 /DNA_ID=CAMNT_0018612685 /DNA_START=10 /DNA_END=609 /DNA_ORIENTATION=-